MLMRQRTIAVTALAAGMMLATVPAAFAQGQSTPRQSTLRQSNQSRSGGWIRYNPSFYVQQEGCGQVSGLTFKLTCTSTGGFDRAERRYEDYSSGAHKFQGTFKITSMAGSRISLKQTFNDNVGPYFLLAVEQGGTLYSVEGGQTIASGVATVGTPVTVDTVHYVGNKLQVYINGSLKYTTSSPGGSFYDKVGAYRTDSGQGPITVQWSNLMFWHK